jgi:hypothetical protein
MCKISIFWDCEFTGEYKKLGLEMYANIFRMSQIFWNCDSDRYIIL